MSKFWCVVLYLFDDYLHLARSFNYFCFYVQCCWALKTSLTNIKAQKHILTLNDEKSFREAIIQIWVISRGIDIRFQFINHAPNATKDFLHNLIHCDFNNERWEFENRRIAKTCDRFETNMLAAELSTARYSHCSRHRWHWNLSERWISSNEFSYFHDPDSMWFEFSIPWIA